MSVTDEFFFASDSAYSVLNVAFFLNFILNFIFFNLLIFYFLN